MSNTQIYLIRHGETEWNVARRMQGRLDSPLTESGQEQAHAHGALLKTLDGVDEMIVSPSGRTRETAWIINSYVRAPIVYDDALMERDVGEWSGLSIQEIEARYPDAWRARSEDPLAFRPPAGETLADMRERIEPLLERVLERGPRSVALVTHQVSSRVILGVLLDLEPDAMVRVIHPNDVLYALPANGAGVESVSHYRCGRGPFDGLMTADDGGIVRPIGESR